MGVEIKFDYSHVEDSLPPHRLRIKISHKSGPSMGPTITEFEGSDKINKIRDQAQQWLEDQNIWHSCFRETTLSLVFYFFNSHNAMLLRMYLSDLVW